MFETRKEFLQEVMQRAGLDSIQEADRIAQVVIGLIKARFGPELSRKVTEILPADLAAGWNRIALPSEAMELQEMMFELDEIGQEEQKPVGTPVPYDYG